MEVIFGSRKLDPLAVTKNSPELQVLVDLAITPPKTPAAAFASSVALAVIHYWETGVVETVPGDIAGVRRIATSTDLENLRKRAAALRAFNAGDVGCTGAGTLRNLMLRLIEARATYLMGTTVH